MCKSDDSVHIKDTQMLMIIVNSWTAMGRKGHCDLLTWEVCEYGRHKTDKDMSGGCRVENRGH